MIVQTRRTRRPDCKSELPSWRALSARCVHVAYGTRAVADSSILAAEEQAASSMGPAWKCAGQLPFSSQSISGRIRSGDFTFSRRAFPGLLRYTAEVPNNTRAHPHLSLRDARGTIWPLCRSFCVWTAVPTQHAFPSGPFAYRPLLLPWRGCAQLHARRGVRPVFSSVILPCICPRWRRRWLLERHAGVSPQRSRTVSEQPWP